MIAPLSEHTIRQLASDISFSRGEDYYQQGSVIDLVQRGNQIDAEVEGSEAAPYRVSFQVNAAGVTAAACTCPYDYGGWCKHTVAAALAWVRQPDRIEVRPTLPQLLDRLDPVQTQRLVQALVAEQPDLIEAIDRHVMLMTNPVAPAATPRRRTTIDVAPFRRQVKQILREGVRSLEDGYEDDPITEPLLDVIEKALEFARNEDGNSAIAILSAITDACVDEWDEISDYGGDCFPIVESLNDAWTEAILTAELSPPEAVDLGVMLADWQDGLDGDLTMSLAALQQGWTDPNLQRALQGRGYADPAGLEAPFGQDLALIRLQILDRQERHTEYMNLAQAEGLMLHYLTRLAQLGQVEEALRAAGDRMSTAEEAFALAKTLRETEHLSEALSIAQAGLPMPGECRYALASWTSELAEGLGDRSAAREASIVAFQLRPSFADYQRVANLAEQWNEIKPDLLASLRQSQTWEANAARVDIFLHEGLVEDAIQAVRADSYYRSDLVHRVMQAAVATHPDWVIETACQQAEPILDRGKSDRYSEAVKWLQQAKAAYLQAGRQGEWVTYFNQLQSDHGRKRKLMELFQKLR